MVSVRPLQRATPVLLTSEQADALEVALDVAPILVCQDQVAFHGITDGREPRIRHAVEYFEEGIHIELAGHLVYEELEVGSDVGEYVGGRQQLALGTVEGQSQFKGLVE